MKRIAAILLLASALSAALGCTTGAQTARALPADNTPALAPVTLTLSVAQTTFNAWTKRRTERTDSFTVSAGDQVTLQSESKVWSLTLTIERIADDGVHIGADHGMLAYRDGVRETAVSRAFTVPLGAAYTLDEPAENITASYSLLFTDARAQAPPTPDGILLTQPQILSNVRRTLHENGKFYFTETELSLILFVKLKGGEVLELSELERLTSVESLTLEKTRVRDLSPLASLPRLFELTLLENRLLDVSTMPALPSLSTLTIDEGFTEDEVRILRTKLPRCEIIIDTGIEDA